MIKRYLDTIARRGLPWLMLWTTSAWCGGAGAAMLICWALYGHDALILPRGVMAFALACGFLYWSERFR